MAEKYVTPEWVKVAGQEGHIKAKLRILHCLGYKGDMMPIAQKAADKVGYEGGVKKFAELWLP